MNKDDRKRHCRIAFAIAEDPADELNESAAIDLRPFGWPDSKYAMPRWIYMLSLHRVSPKTMEIVEGEPRKWCWPYCRFVFSEMEAQFKKLTGLDAVLAMKRKNEAAMPIPDYGKAVRVGMKIMELNCPGDPATGTVVAIGKNGCAMITDGGGDTTPGDLWVVGLCPKMISSAAFFGQRREYSGNLPKL